MPMGVVQLIGEYIKPVSGNSQKPGDYLLVVEAGGF